jgi:hypothetical protein
MFVSGNFFRTLGVSPMLGRAFLDSEHQAIGRDAVAVLGHDFWKAQYGASPAVISSSIWLNGVPFTMIGVAPEQFTGIDQILKPSVFVPLAMSPRLGQDNLERREIRWLTVKGRLQPDASIARADLDLRGITNRLEQMYPQSNRNRRVQVQSEFQFRVQESPPIRMALGADRQRVVGMVLRQGLTLAGIGAAAGMILSFLAWRALTSALWVASFSHFNYVLFPAIAVPLLLVTLLASYEPARRASLIDPMRGLREE